MAVMSAVDGSYALVYSPDGEGFDADLAVGSVDGLGVLMRASGVTDIRLLQTVTRTFSALGH